MAPRPSIAAPTPIGAFLDYGVRKTLHKWLVRGFAALPLPRPQDVVTSRYGVKMRANWRDRTFQYCRYATYGHVLSDYLAAQNRPFVFVDIGANQGLYSLLAAQNPQCTAALAFEPVGATFALLGENIALNGQTGKIRPIHAAVSLHSGMARIATDPAHTGVASLRDAVPTATAGGEDIRILGIGGVDALLAGTEPLVIKIDVEGHEETVVDALMASEHRDRIAALFYEIDRRWSDAAAIETRLRAAGFTRFDRFGFGRHYDVLARR
ncbi:MAG: FkbM family methyltransferase [Sphingopyxis sp.]|uniref:FkbM family methyltransferase n=1 Tax=Sphingopyxis sp. TaxID=1908224 RepID=UPI003D810741